jgi:murein DD-endopeptidase MepM/ murein hydrolase activator NlpD
MDAELRDCLDKRAKSMPKWVFPLFARPKASYHEPPRSFGAARQGGQRKHAACDLYAPHGTPVRAVSAGRIVGLASFFEDVWALTVNHDGFLVRYGEVAPDLPPGLSSGSRVAAGQVIAHVGKLRDGTAPSDMLHLEVFAGCLEGPLSQPDNPPFKRRGDLLDPTPFLDAAAV